jgi:hypothetical protein
VLTLFAPLLLLIVQYHFSEITKILILPIEDIPQGIMYYFITPCLTYDWSALYNEASVDAAVDRSNAAVAQAINLAVPSGCVANHKYPIGSLAD